MKTNCQYRFGNCSKHVWAAELPILLKIQNAEPAAFVILDSTEVEG